MTAGAPRFVVRERRVGSPDGTGGTGGTGSTDGTGGGDDAACERILRALPDWFGIEESIVAYVRDLPRDETFLAETDGAVAGFLALRRHTPHAAEIHVMAVAPGHHGRGAGTLLVARAEEALRADGVEFLQVKTLAPSVECPAYARTRCFYERRGFVPLEELPLWGPGNPCLVMVKHLACGELRRGDAAAG